MWLGSPSNTLPNILQRKKILVFLLFTWMCITIMFVKQNRSHEARTAGGLGKREVKGRARLVKSTSCANCTVYQRVQAAVPRLQLKVLMVRTPQVRFSYHIQDSEKLSDICYFRRR